MNAFDALGSITKWPDGAEAIVATKMLDYRSSGTDYYHGGRGYSDQPALALETCGTHWASCSTERAGRPSETTCNDGALRDGNKDIHKRIDKTLQALDNHLARKVGVDGYTSIPSRIWI
ncbi:hypothetical protein FB451DRAFT_1165075 [Mycena latifolia]|nr:hypothetical protein FB451DRAFT_1165075 [Mycena latifolia]